MLEGGNIMNIRLIEYGVGVVATLMIALGLLIYAVDEPSRVMEAQAAQLRQDLDEAMTLYAENCAVCHGLAGEGIAAVPALNTPQMPEREAGDLFKLIERGVSGSQMPAWGQGDGGPLSDYQVGELVTLLQAGDWQRVQDRVVNLGMAPLVPFTTQVDPQVLEGVQALPGGEILSTGLVTYAENCVACHGADGLGSSLAPALNDPLVREKTAEEIERTVTNGVPATLMAGWEGVLPGETLSTLVELVQRWDEIPLGAVPEPDRPVPVTAESLALGESLYSQNCSRCHGPDGQGSQRAPALNVQSFLSQTADPAIQQIITMGVPGTNMPAWGDRMTEAQIQAVVGFLRSWEPQAPASAQTVRIGGPWWMTSQGANLPSGGAANAQVKDPAAGATTGNQAQDPAAAAQHSGQIQGNPPWLQALQIPWYNQVDWRAVALAAGMLAAGLGLAGFALFGLRRLPAVD